MSRFRALQEATGIVALESQVPWVHQFENVLSPQICDAAVSFITAAKPTSTKYIGLEPWHDGDNIMFQEIADEPLKAQFYAYRLKLTQLVSMCYETIVYPTHSDLVMWRTGRSQAEHKDTGHVYPQHDHLTIRKFSSVTYLNDDFEGGETFIRAGADEYFLNTPKKGSAILFPADERCPHGVTEIRSGVRVTFPIWFTDIVAHCERENGFVVSDRPAAAAGHTVQPSAGGSTTASIDTLTV